MSFNSFLNILLSIVNSFITWITSIFGVLYQNYIFKIVFFVAIGGVFVNLIFRLLNVVSVYKIEHSSIINDLEDNDYDTTYDPDYDDDFWEEE